MKTYTDSKLLMHEVSPMFMTFIDIEQPHLSVFYTKKYYNKKFGTNLKSLKKLKHYYRQYFRRKVNDMSNYEIHPMGEPDWSIFNVKYTYNTDNLSGHDNV